jgi:hypothetical protein
MMGGFGANPGCPGLFQSARLRGALDDLHGRGELKQLQGSDGWGEEDHPHRWAFLAMCDPAKVTPRPTSRLGTRHDCPSIGACHFKHFRGNRSCRRPGRARDRPTHPTAHRIAFVEAV